MGKATTTVMLAARVPGEKKNTENNHVLCFMNARTFSLFQPAEAAEYTDSIPAEG